MILAVYAASAMAGNSVVRSVLGGTLPLAGPASKEIQILSPLLISSASSSYASDIIQITPQLALGYLFASSTGFTDKTDIKNV